MVKLWNMLQQLPTLFDGIALPEGLDHDSMVNSILFEAAELPPIYADPALLKQMINHYFKTRLAIHSQLVSVLSVEYDPIENYNRYEERNTSGSNEVTTTDSETINTTDLESINTTENGTTSGTVTSNTNGSTSGEVENTVSAFNADTYQPDDHTDSTTTSDTSTETETGGTSANTGTSQKTGSGTSQKTGSGKETGTHSGQETAHIHGNIGVTTSQQMIESSIELLGVSDVYRYITADFIKTFCIRCY